MDYIKKLQKLRTELLEAPNTNEKSVNYKILAYKKALEDFKNKEEKSFLLKILGNSIKKCNIEDTEELHIAKHTQKISDNFEIETIGNRRTYTTKL